MDFNQLIARAKAILLTPKTEWPVIADEPASVAGLYKNYIVVLAAIPAIFGFIKTTIIGVTLPFVGGSMRIGMGAGISGMIVTYVLTLVGVYVVALIVDALAPTFGGQKNPIQALKTVAYSYTAAWIAGFAQIFPLGLSSLIALAAGIYGIYLLYIGLPHTMKSPADKSAGYVAVTVIIAIVVGWVMALIVGGVTGFGMRSGYALNQSTDSSDVQFDKDSSVGKLQDWSRNVEAAGKNLESAEKSGDKDAQAAALKQVMGAALSGGAAVESLPPDQLKGFIPETLGGLPRTDFSVERNNTLGVQISEARGTFANDGGASMQLEITDTGGAKGLLSFASWAGLEGERQTGQGYEKTYRSDGRLIHEAWSGSHGEYVVVLGDRFTVNVQGDAMSIDELKAALSDVDLGGLEALKDAGVRVN